MFSAIPIQQLISSTPQALPAGSPLASGALHVITQSDQLPLDGQVYAVYSDTQATNTFGAGTPEEAIAQEYFPGMNNGDQVPSVLYFTRFNTTAVSAWIAGTSTPTLTQVQALAGTFTVNIDGRIVTTSDITLSAATSLSEAATLITTGLQNPSGLFQGTASQTAGSNTVDITATTSGSLQVGDILTGTGVPAGLTVTAVGAFANGVGTVEVSTTTGFASTTVSVGSLATCTLNPVQNIFQINSPTTGPNSIVAAGADISGSILGTLFANPLVSSGAAPGVPATFMQSSWSQFQNYSTLALAWAPQVSEGLAWAQAKDAVTQDIVFPMSQQDGSYTSGINLTGTLKAAVANINDIPVYFDTSGYLWAALLGTWRASVNYDQPSTASSTPAYKSSPVAVADVTDGISAANLNANQVNYYGTWGGRSGNTKSFLFGDWNSGLVSSISASYGQKALANKIDSDILTWMTSIKRFPYTPGAYAALKGVIVGGGCAWGLNNGIIQKGVELSPTEISAITQATGGNTLAAAEVQNKGYFVYVGDPGPSARAANKSPIITVIYGSGGTVLFVKPTLTNVQ